MKAPVKCQLTWCGRPSSSRGYCKLHALRLVRGTPLDKPIRTRGPSPRRQLLDEVADICDLWAGNYQSPEIYELANLFRRLQ